MKSMDEVIAAALLPGEAARAREEVAPPATLEEQPAAAKASPLLRAGAGQPSL